MIVRKQIVHFCVVYDEARTGKRAYAARVGASHVWDDQAMRGVYR